MSSDERKRAAQRAAKNDPTDPMNAAHAAAEAERTGDLTEAAFLRGFVGKWIYVETVRINYRGLLRAVTTDSFGNPRSLIVEPCARVGAWQVDQVTSECLMTGERAVRWECVLEFGAQLSTWPTEIRTRTRG